jgi:serine/threonine protein kinase
VNEPAHGKPLTAEDPPTLGDYELLGRLGEGGMGTVYLGSSTTGQKVAVKVIRTELATDDDFLARFRDEALLARRVSPFCTAQVLDYGMAGKIPYLVTEFVEGQSLEDVVAAQGGLPHSTVHGIAVGVSAALTAIHAAGLMHRDLKPSNVLLSQSGPRVIDFGIAKPTENTTGRKSTVGVLVGTPGWIAPEQLTGGETTTAVDVWAWGCLVAYAATGRHPFGRGNAAAIAYRALHDEPMLGDMPAPLDGLVRSALAPDPANRPKAQRLLLNLVGGDADAPDTKSAMTAFLGGWSPPAGPPAGSGPHPSASGPHPGMGPMGVRPPQAPQYPMPGRPMPPHPSGPQRQPHPSGPQAGPQSGARPPMPPSGMRPRPAYPGQPPGQMRPGPPSGPRPAPIRPTGAVPARPPQTGVHPRTGQIAPPSSGGGEDNSKLVTWIAIGAFVGLAVVFVIVVIISLAHS